jgi:hypothetical protein
MTMKKELKPVTLTGRECADLVDALEEWEDAVGPKEVDEDEVGLDYIRYHTLVSKLKGE